MTPAESLIAWKGAQRALIEMGRRDLANLLLAYPERRVEIIGRAGAFVDQRLGTAKAVRVCELLTLLTDNPLPELD